MQVHSLRLPIAEQQERLEKGVSVWEMAHFTALRDT